MRPGVHFVASQHDRFTTFAEKLRDVLIEIGHARLHIDHENDEVGLLDAQGNLGADGRFEFVIALGDPATGVNDCESLLGPKRMPVFPVASRAAGGVGDGVPRLRKPVEQGAFADVWAANDCDEVLHLKRVRRAMVPNQPANLVLGTQWQLTCPLISELKRGLLLNASMAARIQSFHTWSNSAPSFKPKMRLSSVRWL